MLLDDDLLRDAPGDRVVLLDDDGALIAGPVVMEEQKDGSLRATIVSDVRCSRAWLAVLNDDNTVRQVNSTHVWGFAQGDILTIERRPTPRHPVPPNPKGPVL